MNRWWVVVGTVVVSFALGVGVGGIGGSQLFPVESPSPSPSPVEVPGPTSYQTPDSCVDAIEFADAALNGMTEAVGQIVGDEREEGLVNFLEAQADVNSFSLAAGDCQNG